MGFIGASKYMGSFDFAGHSLRGWLDLAQDDKIGVGLQIGGWMKKFGFAEFK